MSGAPKKPGGPGAGQKRKSIKPATASANAGTSTRPDDDASIQPDEPTIISGAGKADASTSTGVNTAPSTKFLPTRPQGGPSYVSLNTYVVDRRPPVDRGKWENFKTFVWNKEKGLICGRKPLSWCKVILYYLTFIFIMIGTLILFIHLMTEHLKTAYPKTPMVPKRIVTVILPTRTNSLLWYRNSKNSSKPNTQHRYVKNVENVLKMYDHAQSRKHEFSNCEKHREPSKPCLFTRDKMGPCGVNEFGYRDKKPCIYIKLNKLREWEPEYYEDTTSLPDEMPHSLKEVILADPIKQKVWIHCDGLRAYDTEHLGHLTYYPSQGIMGYYFPFTGEDNYLTPLVAVKLNEVKSGLIIDMKCTIWAKNIDYQDSNYFASNIQIYM